MYQYFFLFYMLAVLIFSAILHEIAHGYAALRFGDTTAKDMGRLTLNPIKHLDPFMSVFLPLLLVFSGSPIILGGAKPVPYNPRNLSNYRWGTFCVAIAGIVVNFMLAAFFGLVMRALVFLDASDSVLIMMFPWIWVNILLGVFNLLPIPPLDGAKVFGSLFGFPLRIYERMDIIGMCLLPAVLLLMMFSGLWEIIIDIMAAIFSFLTGVSFR